VFIGFFSSEKARENEFAFRELVHSHRAFYRMGQKKRFKWLFPEDSHVIFLHILMSISRI